MQMVTGAISSFSIDSISPRRSLELAAKFLIAGHRLTPPGITGSNSINSCRLSSETDVSWSGIRRARHWHSSIDNSHSATFSQPAVKLPQPPTR